MMKHLVGQASNGFEVYVDLIQSDIAKHISRQPRLLTLVGEALAHTKLKGVDIVIERDMGRAVGYDFVVPTTEANKVFYAKLLREDGYTRFVRDVKPTSTQFVTLVLHRSEDGSYELQQALIGKLVPPRPGDAAETPEGRDYWAQHAYVFDKQSIQAQSLTKECPY